MSRQHNQDGGDVNVQTDDEPYVCFSFPLVSPEKSLRGYLRVSRIVLLSTNKRRRAGIHPYTK